MATKQREKTGWQEGLIAVSNGFLAPMPELPSIEFADVEDLEAQAAEVRDNRDKIQSWVITTLSQMDIVRNASREARELAAERIQYATEELNKLLHQEKTAAYRRAAWEAFLTHRLSRSVKSHDEVVALLEELVQNGYLVKLAPPSPDDQARSFGDIFAYDRSFSISPDAMFGEQEKAEVRRLLVKLQQQAYEAVRLVKMAAVQNLMDQSGLTEDEFLAFTPGRFAIEVPPEPYQTEEGPKWRSGGIVLLEVTPDQFILPIAATAGLQHSIEEAVRLQVRLKADSLHQDTAPFIPNLVREKGAKVKLLWHIIKRGLHASAKRREMAELKNDFAESATISAEEFYAGQTGVALIQYDSIWDVLSPDRQVVGHIDSMFFLVERFLQEKEDGQKRFIRITQLPPHLSEYLAQCQGEYPEGEKFQGVPYPLGAVLQAVYGQLAKAAHINNGSNK